MKRKMTLIIFAVALACSIFSCCAPMPTKENFISEHTNNKGKMTAIIYSSKYGTTEKICQTIKSHLNNPGRVEMIALEKGPKWVDLNKYNTVILGTSIYAGKPRKSMVEFCRQHEKELMQKRLLLFVCGMDRGNAIKEIEASYPQSLLDRSMGTTFFEGEYHLDKMSVGDKMLLRVFFKVKESKIRDYADDVRMFIQSIANHR